MQTLITENCRTRTDEINSTTSESYLCRTFQQLNVCAGKRRTAARPRKRNESISGRQLTYATSSKDTRSAATIRILKHSIINCVFSQIKPLRYKGRTPLYCFHTYRCKKINNENLTQLIRTQKCNMYIGQGRPNDKPRTHTQVTKIFIAPVLRQIREQTHAPVTYKKHRTTSTKNSAK